MLPSVLGRRRVDRLLLALRAEMLTQQLASGCRDRRARLHQLLGLAAAHGLRTYLGLIHGTSTASMYGPSTTPRFADFDCGSNGIGLGDAILEDGCRVLRLWTHGRRDCSTATPERVKDRRYVSRPAKDIEKW